MVRIVTDSAADFEPAELERMNIACVPLSVFFGATEYQENKNITKEQFYELLVTEQEFPRTAQPSPYEYETLIREAREQGDEILIITLSSQISGTYESVVLLKDAIGYDGCYVFDSANATGGQRILVEHAVRMRDAGHSAREIVEELEKLSPRITLFACIETLEYLWRGGRISGGEYTLGTIAHIKPVITVTVDGRIEVPAKILGMRRGINFIEKKIQEAEPDTDYPFYVMYICDRKNADILADQLRKLGIDIPESNIINVGAGIGSHVGPGGCGYVYIAKEQ